MERFFLLVFGGYRILVLCLIFFREKIYLQGRGLVILSLRLGERWDFYLVFVGFSFLDIVVFVFWFFFKEVLKLNQILFVLLFILYRSKQKVLMMVGFLIVLLFILFQEGDFLDLLFGIISYWISIILFLIQI